MPSHSPSRLLSPRFFVGAALASAIAGLSPGCSRTADAADVQPATPSAKAGSPVVGIMCNAELTGSGRTVAKEAASPERPLENQAPDVRTSIELGRFSLESDLLDMARDDQGNERVWRVTFTEAGRAPADPLATFELGGLELDSRATPLVMRSRHFPSPALVWEVDGKATEVTRIDWTCKLSTRR